MVGKKGSGKTTAAEIAKKLGYQPLAFADAIKLTAEKVFNIPLKILNDPISKDSMQITSLLNEDQISKFLWELSNNYVSIHPSVIAEAIGQYKGPTVANTPRQLLQVLGTDLVRDCVDEDYWLKAVMAKVKPGSKYVIHDVRFQNECDFIKDKLNGHIIVINRPGISSNDYHISEQFIPKSYDFLINNSKSLKDFNISIISSIELAEYSHGSKF